MKGVPSQDMVAASAPRVKSLRRKIIEFGDFQTPEGLAGEICKFLFDEGIRPLSLLEPTCGKGAFIQAALETFPTLSTVIGVEINRDYAAEALRRCHINGPYSARVNILQDDFFGLSLEEIVNMPAEPMLILGNPPWVTNSQMSAIEGANLPSKTNYQGLAGIEALTGKSNFDISESVILKLLDTLLEKKGAMAMLCKTSVARKTLVHFWRRNERDFRCEIYLIDAGRHFGASVDACLLFVSNLHAGSFGSCDVYARLSKTSRKSHINYDKVSLVKKTWTVGDHKHLERADAGPDHGLRWRSGIKHDCSKVMELANDDGCFRNGFGEKVSLEPTYVYPLLKSSDLATGACSAPRKAVIVPQRRIGTDTSEIRLAAPRTWAYLMERRHLLDRRASVIYSNRPRFSIFGVGAYTFAPWKVAISGFYKKIDFKVVGNLSGRPIVFDDTCYFVPCRTQEQAELLSTLLNSHIARECYEALIFWDSKRPITIGVLKRLSFFKLAEELGCGERFKEVFREVCRD
jgi:hypothetical protein